MKNITMSLVLFFQLLCRLESFQAKRLRKKDPPNPRIKPWSPALQKDSLPSEPPGKPELKGSSADFISWLLGLTLAIKTWIQKVQRSQFALSHLPVIQRSLLGLCQGPVPLWSLVLGTDSELMDGEEESSSSSWA